MPTAGDNLEMIPVGQVRRPVGLKGEISITAFGDDPSRFKPGMSLRLGGADYKVASARRGPNRGILLRLEGVEDAETATRLRGEEILALAADLPKQPEDVYYHFQLIGLAVQTLAGHKIGRVAEIMETGGNDVYVVRGDDLNETLVPALKNVIVGIDLAAGTMTIDPPPGLIE